MRSVEDSGNRLARNEAQQGEQTVNLVGEFSRDGGARSPEFGRTFADRYEILEKLGEGGVGTVYKARHLHLDTTLAIKILQSTHMKDADSVARFCREGKLISRLNHPNIVKVQEFGVYDGCPYMTMDYIDGQPISKMIGSTDTDTWVAVFRQVLDALAHAHQRGIIHRDIKPGNILFNVDETGAPVATVVDFGLAKVINSDKQQADSEALTRTGDLFGTPLYMSPEQCTGSPIDSLSDIYSLGCVMYHCLTGAPPFQGQSNFELVYRQINSSPSNFSAELRQRGIGADLEAIVLKAMAKRKSSRYQYAEQMSVDLLNTRRNGRNLVSESLAILRLINGRFKASQRAAILRSTATTILTLNAIITALCLILLPGRMEQENLLVNRYANVRQQMHDFTQIGLLREGSRAKVQSGIENLERLTHDDPVLEPMAKAHIKRMRTAWSTLGESIRKAQNQIYSGNGNASLLTNGLTMLREGIDPWMISGASNALLTAEASDLLNKNLRDLEWKYNLYTVLPTYGAVSALLLAIVLGMSFNARSNEKRRLRGPAGGNDVRPITENSI